VICEGGGGGRGGRRQSERQEEAKREAGYHSFETGESETRGGMVSSSSPSPDKGDGIGEGPCGVIQKQIRPSLKIRG